MKKFLEAAVYAAPLVFALSGCVAAERNGTAARPQETAASSAAIPAAPTPAPGEGGAATTEPDIQSPAPAMEPTAPPRIGPASDLPGEYGNRPPAIPGTAGTANPPAEAVP